MKSASRNLADLKSFKKIIKNSHSYEVEDINSVAATLIDHNIKPADLPLMDPEKLPETSGNRYQRAALCISARKLEHQEKSSLWTAVKGFFKLHHSHIESLQDHKV